MKYLFCLLLALALSGCAPTVQTTVTRAARYTEAAKLRDLAVLPFEGNAGRKISYQVEAALSGVSVFGEPYFRLADRKDIATVLSELKFSNSVLVDPARMARIGMLAGTRGILGGHAGEQPDESSYGEQRTACDEYETVVGQDGKKKSTGRCIKSRQWMATCVKRQVTVTFVPRLVDVETARVVYSRTIQKSRTSSGCLDYSTPDTVAELASAAWRDALDDFMKDVAPYSTRMELSLSDDDDGIPAGDPQKRFSQGVEFAKAGRMDRACEIWSGLGIYAQSAPFLLYNLGICAEIAGNYNSAADYFIRADRLTTTPHENIGKALARVRALQAEQHRLKEQMNR